MNIEAGITDGMTRPDARERRTRAGMTASTRRTLIEIARRHFGEYGFADISLEDMTAAAQMTRGALYHHFGSKTGLFCAIVDDIDEEISRAFERVSERGFDSPNFWEMMKVASACYFEAFRSPLIRQIMIKDAPNYYPGFASRRFRLHSHRDTVRALQRLADQGLLKVEPEAMASMLEGAVTGLVHWAVESDPEFASIQQQFDGFLTALAAAHA